MKITFKDCIEKKELLNSLVGKKNSLIEKVRRIENLCVDANIEIIGIDTDV